MQDQELIKSRRSEPARVALRQAIPNKERIRLGRTPMPELQQSPSLASLYREDKLGFTPEQALAEARRCLDCPTPGCVSACPAGIHIPSFIKLLEQGEMLSSWHILRERSTLSSICSRVCDQDAQCEGGCIYTVSLKGQAVAIGALERYVASWEQEYRHEAGTLETPLASNGLRIAVVGAGPAGLAAAHDLALWGYAVDVYEAQSFAGGVMRTGIPRYRLPAEMIDDEVRRLEGYGVRFHYGVRLGQDISLEALREEGYSAIFLGTGAMLSGVMGVEGETLPGVRLADEYLFAPNVQTEAEFAEAYAQSCRGCVAIIGGGNTAMDAARTARRRGAERVLVIYRRGMEELPACRDEVEHALAEGIEFLTLHQVACYHAGADGRLAEVELKVMRLGEPDESGRRRPIDTGETKRLPIDEAVVCVGVAPDPDMVASLGEVSTKWGSVLVVNEEQETSIPLVYAGGDASRGGATVVLAMRDGRRAAQAIHKRLQAQS